MVLGTGEVVTGKDFGNQSPFGEIRGTKFEDLDGDGVRDAGEPAMAGVTVYIDRNNNGVLDSGGLIEPDSYPAGTELTRSTPGDSDRRRLVHLRPASGVDGAPADRSGFHRRTGAGQRQSASHVWFDTRQLRMDFGTRC